MMKMKSVDCQHVDTVNLAELQNGCSLLEYRCYLYKITPVLNAAY